MKAIPELTDEERRDAERERERMAEESYQRGVDEYCSESEVENPFDVKSREWWLWRQGRLHAKIRHKERMKKEAAQRQVIWDQFAAAALTGVLTGGMVPWKQDEAVAEEIAAFVDAILLARDKRIEEGLNG